MSTDTIDLAPYASPGDRVNTNRGGFTVSHAIWPNEWPQPTTLEPIPLELLDALAPADFYLPSNQRGPESVYPGGRVYAGACRVQTNGAAVVRKNGGDWLRCRIELWDGEGARKMIYGLVRIDR